MISMIITMLQYAMRKVWHEQLDAFAAIDAVAYNVIEYRVFVK